MFAYQVGASEHEKVPINALKNCTTSFHCVKKNIYIFFLVYGIAIIWFQIFVYESLF